MSEKKAVPLRRRGKATPPAAAEESPKTGLIPGSSIVTYEGLREAELLRGIVSSVAIVSKASEVEGIAALGLTVGDQLGFTIERYADNTIFARFGRISLLNQGHALYAADARRLGYALLAYAAEAEARTAEIGDQ